MRIRPKLIVLSLPLVLVSLGVMTRLAQKRVQDILEQEVAKRGLSVSTGVAQAQDVIAGFRGGDERLLLPALQSALESSRGLYAIALDSKGRVLAHTNVAEKGNAYADPLSVGAIGAEEPGYRRMTFEGRPAVDVYCPVRDLPQAEAREEFLLLGKEGGGERARLGVLRLGLPLKEAMETAGRISRQVFWIVTGISGLALTLILLLAERILRPIRLLAEAAKRLGRGALGETVPVRSSDEVGDLADSFNRMSRDLAETTVSKDFLNSILKDMQDALIVTTPAGEVRLANQSALDLLGYPEAELLGRDATTLLEIQGEEDCSLDRLVQRDAPQVLEGVFLTRSGERVPILVGVSAFEDAEGRVAGYIVTARDITERKQAEEARQQLEWHLIQAERLASVGTVAAGIVHNLRGPLSGILGFAGLSKARYPDISYTDRIIDLTNQMNEMVENILSKSRGKRNVEQVDLNALLERELEFLRADPVFKHQVEKEVLLTEDLPPVTCVYTDFSQVFGNLLRNGVEAMYDRRKKRLSVKTVFREGYVVVEIQDTGCGIPEENLPHLYAPFFTTKSGDAESGAPRGTGLGLYMVRQLLESYRAAIEVETEVDVGTTFRVKIPVS